MMNRFFANQSSPASACFAEAVSSCSSAIVIFVGAMIVASIFVMLLSRVLLVRIILCLILIALLLIGTTEYRRKDSEFGNA